MAAFLATLFAFCATTTASADNVLTYHNGPSRSGAYVVPKLTLAAAKSMHRDPGFQAKVPGNVYTQPLFWHPPGGRAVLIITTESDEVVAIDAIDGHTVWERKLGTPASTEDFLCGYISPEGITSTPTIDSVTGILYLDAVLKGEKTAFLPKHFIYALSLSDGAIVPGWPLDVEAELQKQNVRFSSKIEFAHGATQLLRGSLYVAFGSRFDCGNYKGFVLQVKTAAPSIAAVWQARAKGGGIWAQGGLSTDGKDLFAATGNTFSATEWSDGEAVLRLNSDLARSNDRQDFFTPSNWKDLDDHDLDLGGTTPLPFDVPTLHGGAAPRMVAFGKDGNAYLMDRSNLGGIGGNLALLHVSDFQIATSLAAYKSSNSVLVALNNAGSSRCPGTNIEMLQIKASGAAQLSHSWCAPFAGQGTPIVTTSDGARDPIVWAVGAEGDGLLHGFNALSGDVVYSGSFEMEGLHHYQTLIAAEGRLYVGADNTIYAFTFDR